jgi:hypothetical protein
MLLLPRNKKLVGLVELEVVKQSKSLVEGGSRHAQRGHWSICGCRRDAENEQQACT